MGGADSKDATKIQRLYANFKPISPFNNGMSFAAIH